MIPRTDNSVRSQPVITEILFGTDKSFRINIVTDKRVKIFKKQNIDKTAPKGAVRFSVTLSDEQKAAKAEVLTKPYNFILGKAGSGKTLLACQIALDLLFKREVNKIVITRPTVATEDNGLCMYNDVPSEDEAKHLGLSSMARPLPLNIQTTFSGGMPWARKMTSSELWRTP